MSTGWKFGALLRDETLVECSSVWQNVLGHVKIKVSVIEESVWRLTYK